MLQIYFDFSGYSDMAIGLGWMFGFHFKENFNYPYISGQHPGILEKMAYFPVRMVSGISLYSAWAETEKENSAQLYNKMIVFLCTGIWHGAAVNFLFWGVYHGCFLMLEEYVPWIGRKGSGCKSLYFSISMLFWWYALVLCSSEQRPWHRDASGSGKMFTGFAWNAACHELCTAADDPCISGYPGRCADCMLSCYKN